MVYKSQSIISIWFINVVYLIRGGGAPNRIVTSVERGIGESNSNFNSLFCIHFHTNAFRKDMNLSLLLSMG